MIVVPLNNELPLANAKDDRTGAPGRFRRASAGRSRVGASPNTVRAASRPLRVSIAVSEPTVTFADVGSFSGRDKRPSQDR